MKACSNQRSSSDQVHRQWAWMIALITVFLVMISISQVGCVSAKSFSYGYNEEGGASDGAIRTSRLATNGRRGFELDVAGKSLGEVFSTLSSKIGAPVIPGLGVESDSRISGVYAGSTWEDVLRDVCEQNGFALETKQYQSGKVEAYLVLKRS